MTLPVGTRLGCYEIGPPPGARGMGEVYPARDTRPNREVAIKSLPETFLTDGERLSRFQREAQVLAASLPLFLFELGEQFSQMRSSLEARDQLPLFPLSLYFPVRTPVEKLKYE